MWNGSYGDISWVRRVLWKARKREEWSVWGPQSVGWLYTPHSCRSIGILFAVHEADAFRIRDVLTGVEGISCNGERWVAGEAVRYYRKVRLCSG